MNTQLLTLAQCHERLVCELGASAPALVTLKRWSASGKLVGARISDKKGAAAYRYDVVLRFTKDAACAAPLGIERKGFRRVQAAETPQSSNQVGGAQLDDLRSLVETSFAQLAGQTIAAAASQVGRTVQDLVVKDVLEAQVRSALALLVTDIKAAVQTIDHVSRTLMMKYDAENVALKEKVRVLTKTLADAGAQATVLDVQRVGTSLTRIDATLKDLGLRVDQVAEQLHKQPEAPVPVERLRVESTGRSRLSGKAGRVGSAQASVCRGRGRKLTGGAAKTLAR